MCSAVSWVCVVDLCTKTSIAWITFRAYFKVRVDVAGHGRPLMECSENGTEGISIFKLNVTLIVEVYCIGIGVDDGMRIKLYFLRRVSIDR